MFVFIFSRCKSIFMRNVFLIKVLSRYWTICMDFCFLFALKNYFHNFIFLYISAMRLWCLLSFIYSYALSKLLFANFVKFIYCILSTNTYWVPCMYQVVYKVLWTHQWIKWIHILPLLLMTIYWGKQIAQ